MKHVVQLDVDHGVGGAVGSHGWKMIALADIDLDLVVLHSSTGEISDLHRCGRGHDHPIWRRQTSNVMDGFL